MYEGFHKEEGIASEKIVELEITSWMWTFCALVFFQIINILARAAFHVRITTEQQVFTTQKKDKEMSQDE